MKWLLTLAAVGLLGGMMVGCKASAEVGDDDPDLRSSRTEIRRDDDSYRKTTIRRDSDGDRTVKTEIRRED